MALSVVGVSHRTAPVEVRERFAFGAGGAAEALEGVVGCRDVEEAVLLSTCNRTEVYVVGEPGGEAAAVGVLAERAGVGRREAAPYLYGYRERRGVEHLFRVAAGLDSMVLGEAQIQGQVRAAYQEALEAGSGRRLAGPVLGRLFERALAVGGRVRSETGLGVGAASVPGAAVELAKKIFGTLRGRRAVVVGAGETAALAAEALMGEGVRGVVVASRTEGRARALAERVGAGTVSFDGLGHALAGADVVLSATAAPHLVVTREMLERLRPGGRRSPLLVLDIAVPRDVDPEAGGLDNVFLYDLDDLQQIVDGNLERRRVEVAAAERIVAEEVDGYWAWYAALAAGPVIREVRARAEALRAAEVERHMRRLAHLAPEDRQAIEGLTRLLVNKVLHGPTVRLREAAAEDGSVLETAAYLFGLDGGAPSQRAAVRPEAAGNGEGRRRPERPGPGRCPAADSAA